MNFLRNSNFNSLNFLSRQQTWAIPMNLSMSSKELHCTHNEAAILRESAPSFVSFWCVPKRYVGTSWPSTFASERQSLSDYRRLPRRHERFLSIFYQPPNNFLSGSKVDPLSKFSSYQARWFWGLISLGCNIFCWCCSIWTSKKRREQQEPLTGKEIFIHSATVRCRVVPG